MPEKRENCASLPGEPGSEALQEVRELLDARRTGEPVSPLAAERCGVELAPLPAPVQVQQRLTDRVDVVGSRDDACARVLDELRSRAVRRDDGEDRPFGGDVLEHLPGKNTATATARIGDEQEEHVSLALQAERLTSW